MPASTTLGVLGPSLDELRRGAGVYLDDSRSRIAITGDDRAKWLSGMVTCDVGPLGDGGAPRAAYGCVLNVKGKVLGDVVLIVAGGRFGAFVPKQSARAILELWERYVVMEDVELAIDETRRAVFVQGGLAEEVTANAGLASRAARLDDLGAGDGVVLDASREESEEVVKRLVKEGAVALDDDALRTLRVEAGRATWGVDVDASNYVQEAGLEERAVSFSKGCYVGQEVVCMLQMRGKVHKRLVRVALHGDVAPMAGAEVSADGAVAGKLTSVAPRAEGGWIALAMLKSTAADAAKPLEIGTVRGEVVAPAG